VELWGRLLETKKLARKGGKSVFVGQELGEPFCWESFAWWFFLHGGKKGQLDEEWKRGKGYWLKSPQAER